MSGGATAPPAAPALRAGGGGVGSDGGSGTGAPRVIAFHLPQFHPIPENDEWWGKGFTEWTNVTRARPKFAGHYQPHLPADLGFYDLRVPESRAAQAELAREYGIDGFCYWHYWFNGRRVLEKPVEAILHSGEPDFPFCLAWANEDWTRAWDGESDAVLLKQVYSEEDHRAHARALMPYFADPRYVRVNGRPLFGVYRINNIPEPRRAAAVWREEAERAGLPGLYLCTIYSIAATRVDPSEVGFDAAIEFQPALSDLPPPLPRNPLVRQLQRALRDKPFLRNHICTYDSVGEKMMARPRPPFKMFPGVTPMWDNSARRQHGAFILTDSTPEQYERWLRWALDLCRRELSGDERVVFVNAWNEWAEGNHLEPDRRWGRAYLEATRRAVVDARVTATGVQGGDRDA